MGFSIDRPWLASRRADRSMVTARLSSNQFQKLFVLTVLFSLLQMPAVPAQLGPRTAHFSYRYLQRNKEGQKPSKLGTGSLLLSITFDDEQMSEGSALRELLIEIDAKAHNQVRRLDGGKFELSAIPPGARQLMVFHPSFGTVSDEVEVRPGSTTYFHLVVKRSMANLVVRSEVGAQIFVDDRLRDQVGPSGRSGKIELRPGKHTIRVVKDEFATQEFSRDLASGESELPVPLKRVQFSGPFLDPLLGLEAWDHPKDWRVDRGKLVVSGPGLGWRKNELYKDFTFMFQIRFLNGKGGVWQVRRQDDHYYLFQLALPRGDTDVAKFYTYKVENSQVKLAQSPQQVPIDLTKKDQFLSVILTGRGDEIRHQIENPDRKPGDLEYVNLSVYRDLTNPLLWGKVGFGSRDDEQFVISSPQVIPEDTSGNTPIKANKNSRGTREAK